MTGQNGHGFIEMHLTLQVKISSHRVPGTDQSGMHIKLLCITCINDFCRPKKTPMREMI